MGITPRFASILGRAPLLLGCLGSMGACSSDDTDTAPEPVKCEEPTCAAIDCHLTAAISMRDSTACAMTGAGTVKCWGANAFGQLGLGDTDARGDEPGEMGSDLPAVDLGTCSLATRIWALGAKNCAKLQDGTLKCWGSNDNGFLGLEDTEDRGDERGEMGDALPAVDLGTEFYAEDVTSSCALNFQEMKCWHGYPSEAGRTPGGMGDALPPEDLGGRNPLAVSGTGTVCVLVDDGTLRCWGSNYFGQLGLGDTTTREREPWLLPALDLGQTVRSFSVGAAHGCAILEDHRVKCWGNNTNGQLGIGTVEPHGDQPGEMGDSLPFVDLGTARTAREVVAGEAFSCALLDDFTVKCWGFNGHGELGQGDTRFRGDEPGEMGDALRPVALGAGRTARGLAAGLNSACALLDDSTVKCWGRNERGVLGYGDAEDRGDEPDEMGDALPAVDIGF